MTVGDIFCIWSISTGIILIMAVLTSLAKRQMLESFGLAWGLFAVLLIMAGILLHPTELEGYISLTGILLLLFVAYSFIVGAYALSTALSVLIRKNRELAMHVSILNEEIVFFRNKFNKIEDRIEAD